MNKKALLFSFLLIGFSSFGQSFGIPFKDYPFFRIIEWKGKGGMIMSRNPKEFMNQINLTLVGDKQEGMWDQKFNPKVREPMYLFNEDTRYIYFINNMDLVDNGRASFNQINAAGNIKSKILDVGNKAKYLEEKPDYNRFQCVDAAVTEKTLVYLYRLYNKKEKEYDDYVCMMTHHNLQHLLFPLGTVDANEIKKGNDGTWKYAGFNGDIVFFGRQRFKYGMHGWTVKGFSSKGLPAEDHFLTKPENLQPFTNIGYGNLGANYTTDEKRFTRESGLVSFMNGEFYLLSIRKRDGGHVLQLSQADGEDWIDLNAVQLDPINEEEDLIRLGSFPIHEGITYHYKHQGVDKVGIIYFEEGKEGKQEPFTENSAYNPSALLLDHQQDEFVTTVPSGKTLVFDRTQFGRSSGVSFEHK